MSLALEGVIDDLEAGFFGTALQRLKEAGPVSAMAPTQRVPGKATASAMLARTPPSQKASPPSMSASKKVPPPPETSPSLPGASSSKHKRYKWSGDTYAPEWRARVESLRAKYATSL